MAMATVVGRGCHNSQVMCRNKSKEIKNENKTTLGCSNFNFFFFVKTRKTKSIENKKTKIPK